jgi:hypothetical protein
VATDLPIRRRCCHGQRFSSYGGHCAFPKIRWPPLPLSLSPIPAKPRAALWLLHLNAHAQDLSLQSLQIPRGLGDVAVGIMRNISEATEFFGLISIGTHFSIPLIILEASIYQSQRRARCNPRPDSSRITARFTLPDGGLGMSLEGLLAVTVLTRTRERSDEGTFGRSANSSSEAVSRFG